MFDLFDLTFQDITALIFMMFPPNILYFAIFWKFINGSLSLVLSITSLENHIFHQKDVLEIALSTDILDTINPKVRIVQSI